MSALIYSADEMQILFVHKGLASLLGQSVFRGASRCILPMYG